MPSRQIEKLCKQFEDNDYSLDYELAISAALDLGKLYHFLNESSNEDKELLSNTLNAIKKNLTNDVVQRIWDDINSKNPNNHRQLEGYVVPITALKREMITDIFYLRILDPKSLIQIGQEYQWYRFAMIGLIRRHLDANKVDDPFLHADFSYEYLVQDGAKENSFVLNPFIKKCVTFPVEDVCALGKENEEIAVLILMDLAGTLPFFQVSGRFVDSFPELRATIAQSWQEFFDNNPLDSRLKAFIPDELDRLKKNYPEFKSVDIDSRPSRHSEPHPNGEYKPSNREKVGFFVLAGGMLAFGARKVLCKLACATAVKMAAAAATPAAPVVVGVGLGCLAGYAAAKWGPLAYEGAREWANSRRNHVPRPT